MFSISTLAEAQNSKRATREAFNFLKPVPFNFSDAIRQGENKRAIEWLCIRRLILDISN